MVKQYDDEGHQVISGQKARQGDIVLRTRGMRYVFIGGMASLGLLAVLMVVFLMPG